jgi:hypothetical protein
VKKRMVSVRRLALLPVDAAGVPDHSPPRALSPNPANLLVRHYN